MAIRKASLGDLPRLGQHGGAQKGEDVTHAARCALPDCKVVQLGATTSLSDVGKVMCRSDHKYVRQGQEKHNGNVEIVDRIIH